METYLVRQVKKRGGEVRKIRWIGRRHCPDRALFLPGGRFFLVEMKAPGKKPRPGQEREHTRLWKLGHAVVVLDTKGKVDNFLAGVPKV